MLLCTARLAAATVLGLAPAAPSALASDPLSPTADYTLSFATQWNASNHPVGFPGASAHFSALIGATHAAGATLWEPGGVATPGMESMAEVGGTATLSAEINALLGGGSVDQLLLGPGLFGVPSVSMDFSASSSHPLVSVVTMIAPSPDWFLGVNGLSLVEDGVWVSELSVELLAWDAGTDSGVTYFSANADVTPHVPIALQSGVGPLAGNFTPLGTFTFTRTDSPTWEDLGHGLAGTLGVPSLVGSGLLIPGEDIALSLSGAQASANTALVLGLSAIHAPLKGGLLVPSPDKILFNLSTDASGALELPAVWPLGSLLGLEVYAQLWIQDAGGPVGWAASNAVCTLTL